VLHNIEAVESCSGLFLDWHLNNFHYEAKSYVIVFAGFSEKHQIIYLFANTQ
jgi:hypothetical protein